MAMQKSLIYVLIIVLVVLCSNLIMADEIMTITSFPLENISKDNQINWIGPAVAETIATKLSMLSGIRVVERQQLGNAIKELKLQDSSFIDSSTASKLGKIVGAKYVVIGSFIKQNENLKIDVRMVDVETSEVKISADVIDKFENALEMQLQLAQKLIAALKRKPSDIDIIDIQKPQTKSLSAFEWYGRGGEFLNKSDYNSAISSYTKALELDKNYAESYMSRGFIYIMEHEYDKALTDITEAIVNNPKLAPAYFYRGLAYQQKGGLSDFAITAYTDAIKINSNASSAFYNRGLLYFAKKDYDNALVDFTSVIDIEKKLQQTSNGNLSSSYYFRGFINLNNKDYVDALADFTSIIETEQKLPQTNIGSLSLSYYFRGFVCFEKKDYDNAFTDFTSVIETEQKQPQISNGNSASSYYFRGVINFEKKDYNKAINDFSEVINRKSIYYNGPGLLGKSNYDRAILDFSSSMKLNNTILSYYYRGMSYFNNRKLNRARPDLRYFVNNIGDDTYFKNEKKEVNKLLNKIDMN